MSLSSAAAQAPVPADSVVQALVEEMVSTGRTGAIIVGLLDASGSRRFFTSGDGGPGARLLDEHTVFEIGSVTKVFTSTLLADMSRRGEVRLNEPVAKLLPSHVQVPSRNDRAITLADLASHSSGLPRMPTNFAPRDPGNPYADYSADRLYAFLSGYRLTRDPGAAYVYSNVGVGLLGQALARRLGTTYEVAVRRRILTPLGMTETAITLTPALRAQLVQGHDRFGDRAANWDVPALAGAGALRSTAWDMLTFAAAALSTRPGSPYRGLRDTQIARLPAAPGLTAREGDSVGLGWLVSHRGARTIVWHNGGTGGYRVFLALDPAAKRAVVVLTNRAGYGCDDVGFYILDPSTAPGPRPVSYAVVQAYRERGAAHAIARYRELKRSAAAQWSFDPDELDIVGYWLLEHRHVADAVRMFRLNVEMYPGESNPYDSLGEALLAVGDTAGAIRSYRRSVELNPQNTEGASMLNRLRSQPAH